MLYVFMKANMIRFQYIILWFTTFTFQNKSVILFRRVFRYRSLMFFKNVYHLHTLGDTCTYIDPEFIGKTQKPLTTICEFLEATPVGNLNKINFHAPLSGTMTTVRTISLTPKHTEFCSRIVIVYKHRNKQ
jgi:hypothetical protein